MKRFFATLIALALALAFYAPTVFGAAETLTGTRATDGFPVAGVGYAGSLKTAYGTYDVAANVEDGDIFEMCRIPAGARIVGGWFIADDLDTGTESIDLDVGWAANGTESADPDGLLNAGVLTGDAVTGYKPEAGTKMPFGGVLITNGYQDVSRETVIQVEANAAAATFAAGTITVIVHYLMEE